MRKYLTALLLISCFAINAQTNTATSAKPENAAETALSGPPDKVPEFPGGISAFMKYIMSNYQMPDVDGLIGRVVVTFVIETDGSVTDVKVIKDLGHGTAEEAIRVLLNSPKWIPGEQNGQKVRVNYSLPIAINTGG